MPESQTIIFRGGLDLVSPGLQKVPGFCISSSNYEPDVRGYRRREGYERFDGQPKPSETWPHKQLNYDAGTTEPSVGAKITGATSGAYGWLYSTPIVLSGDWGTNDAAGWFILRNVVGTFEDDEDLQIAGPTTVAVADGTQVFPTYEDEDTEDTTRLAGIAQARALIAAVPGSGNVLGVATLNGITYAWRNNAGGTAVVMHAATESGWTAQSFGDTLDFTAGTAEIEEGETVTGGTSSATATVERVVITSGAWGDSDAAGYLVLSGTSGTFQSETITSASGSATASGAQAAITLPAGGTYRATTHNFYGTAKTARRLYGVNGQGYAFEWDGTVLAPIRTGVSASLDKPTHVGVWSNHLVLGYVGGGLQVSGIGLPLQYNAVDGAFEKNLGQDVTGILDESRTACIITGRNKIAYLTGNDSVDSVLQDVSQDSGAIEDTLQIVGKPIFVDDQGIRDMETAASFGDWTMGTMSQLVQPYFKTKKKAGAGIVGSQRVRSKDLYRLFWDDGSFLSMYMGRDAPEILPCELGFTPTCFVSAEDDDGNEILLAGSTTGMVYQIDAGRQDDGAAMTYFLRTTFAHQGMPNVAKRYHAGLMEFDDVGPQGALSIAADFEYGEPDLVAKQAETFTAYGLGGFWDEAIWNEFYWGAKFTDKVRVDIDGIGDSISLVFAGTSTDEDPHTLSGVTLKWSQRRAKR